MDRNRRANPQYNAIPQRATRPPNEVRMVRASQSTGRTTKQVRQVPVVVDMEYDDKTVSLNPRSAVRYKTQEQTRKMIRDDEYLYDDDRVTDYEADSMYIPTRRQVPGPMLARQINNRAARPARTDVDRVVNAPKRRLFSGFHPTVYIGVGMIAMLTAYELSLGIISGFTTGLDDMKYGRPRESHSSFVVGHKDSTEHPSEFICSNIDSKISVIEMPGGELKSAKVYMVVKLVNQPLIPCTVDFNVEPGGKHPSMIVHVGNEDFTFDNNGTVFTERQ